MTCGWTDCECQTVVASCNTCMAPIFGRENYDRLDHKEAAPYAYSTYTCEFCLEQQEAA
jgi:hypothetical protein